jgi:ammonia channel protein AmtB
MKTVFDIAITGLGWWLIGYGIAYGTDDVEFVGNTQVLLHAYVNAVVL